MPDQEQAKVTLSDVPVDKPCPIAVGGGFVKSQSTNVAINLGKTISVRNIKRFPLRFDSNSKEFDYGIESDFRNACWIGKVLIVVVGEKGKRRVSWDYNRGGFLRRLLQARLVDFRVTGRVEVGSKSYVSLIQWRDDNVYKVDEWF